VKVVNTIGNNSGPFLKTVTKVVIRVFHRGKETFSSNLAVLRKVKQVRTA